MLFTNFKMLCKAAKLYNFNDPIYTYMYIIFIQTHNNIDHIKRNGNILDEPKI